MKDDMDLPEGRTCWSCTFITHCRLLFQCKVENTRCDWSPSRYQEYHAPAEYPVDPSAECSAEALAKVDAARIKAAVAAEYASRPLGGTADEIAAVLVHKGQVPDILSVRPRVSDLKRNHILVPTGERRVNAKGNTAAVMVHRMYWGGLL